MVNNPNITQVVPIDLNGNSNKENGDQDIERTLDDNPVHLEKLEMMKRAQKRFQAFKKIIYNQQDEPIPYSVTLYGIAGILFGVSINLFTTMIPMRDPIKNSFDPTDTYPQRLSGLVGLFGS